MHVMSASHVHAPCEQAGGGKVTNPKDMDKLRSVLESLVGTSSGRSLSRMGSLKRPVVGEPEPADQKKALLNKLKGKSCSVRCIHAWSTLGINSIQGNVAEVVEVVAPSHIDSQCPLQLYSMQCILQQVCRRHTRGVHDS